MLVKRYKDWPLWRSDNGSALSSKAGGCGQKVRDCMLNHREAFGSMKSINTFGESPLL